MDRPVIDHRGPEFATLAKGILENLHPIFQTVGAVVVYPASGTGAWEASIVNTLSPGDRVLMFETGHFSQLWCQVAERFGIKVDYVPGNWRRGVDPNQVEARLRSDHSGALKAVLVVHNETSTGVTSRISEIRQAMKSSRPSGSADRRHDLFFGFHRLSARRMGR
jgi:alanine-glyoxylate transaminase / serine-glyoxylate transaminase / serine-pyruvate transaminase